MKRCCLVAAGPSLKETLSTLRELSESGVDVVCVNHSHDWLIKHGITPKFCILPESFHFTEIAHTVEGCVYVIRKDARPETRKTVKDGLIKEYSITVNTRITLVGLPVLNVAHWLGYREFDLFGFDGSYPDAKSAVTHMDGTHKWTETKSDIRWCVAGNRMFKSRKRWRRQTQALIELLTKELPVRLKVVVRVHGDGLMAAVARSIQDIEREIKIEKKTGTDHNRVGPFRRTRDLEVWTKVRGDIHTVTHRPANPREVKKYLKGTKQ